MDYKAFCLTALTPAQATTILSPTAGKRVGNISICITNTESTNAAALTLTRCSSTGTVLSTLLKEALVAGGALNLKQGILIPASDTPHILRIESDQDSISVDVSWTES